MAVTGYIKVPRELIERLGHGIELMAAIYLLETADYETGKLTMSLRELMRETGIGHTKASRVFALTGTLSEQNRNRTGTPRTALVADPSVTAEQNRNTFGTEPGHFQEKPPHTPLKETTKTKQEKETTIARAREAFILPNWVDVEAWNGWEEMRKVKGWKLTNRAKALAVKALEALREQGYAPKDVLDNATLRCWRGLFAPSSGSGGESKADRERKTTERIVNMVIEEK